MIRIPRPANSKPVIPVSPAIPDFAAVYDGPATGPGLTPAIEDMFTIDPLPDSNIGGISCFMHSHVPFRLLFIVVSQSSTDCSRVDTGFALVAPPPALLNAISSDPKDSKVFSIKLTTLASSETSVLT